MVGLVVAEGLLKVETRFEMHPLWSDPPQMVFCSITITRSISSCPLNTLFTSNIKW